MQRTLRAVLATGLLTIIAFAPAPSRARDSSARMVSEAEAPVYRAVGRLNIAGNRHCTATLISSQLALTAAHCLFNPLTGVRALPQNLRFVAGQRGKDHAALRGVLAAVTLPGYVFRRMPGGSDSVNDLALLHLDAPIPDDAAMPFVIGGWDRVSPVSMIAFGRDRAYIASLREGCQPTDATVALVVLDCPVVPGVSGAPLLRPGPQGPVVVGVVSAAMGNDRSALVVVVTPEVIEVLKRALLGTAI